ncbi:hypothetical protein Ancab_022177 [Ancistrocladus abbreviatus]
MSRCFPFPPPGYAKKLSIDDIDLLAKEKRKEKKEKKHKKDKDKNKGGKEKKDKERSKDKHRDKKQKREKHKDKKRDKNHKKCRNPDEGRAEGQSECSNVENTVQTDQFEDTSVVQELGRRIRDEDCATGSQSFEKGTDMHHNDSEFSGKVVINNVKSWSEGKESSKDKNRDKNTGNGRRDHIEAKVPKVAIVCNFGGMEQRMAEMFSPLEKDIKQPVEGKEKKRPHGIITRVDKDNFKDEKIFKAQSRWSDGKKFGPVGRTDQFMKTASIQELGRGVGDEDGSGRSHISEHITGTNHKKAEPLGKVAEGNASCWSAGREFSNIKVGCDSKVNEHRDATEVRGPKFSIVQNLKGMEQKGVEMARAMEEDTKKNMEGKHWCKTDGGRKSGDKDEKREGRSKGENKHKERKVEKAKVGKDLIGACKPYIFKESSRAPAGEGNTIKRKQPETNGFLLENDIRPSKLPKLISVDNTVAENGRKLEVSSTVTKSVSEEKGTAINNKQDKKEHKIEGAMDGRQTVTPMRPLSATTEAEQIQKPSSKPPHPGAECLSSILSVPKIDEWSDFDDQEWLFGSNSLPSKKTEVGCPRADAEQQVWAKALYIESADVSALPFVLPY